jgi:C4-dicarboxylate-specific signal transduction histidine kinase
VLVGLARFDDNVNQGVAFVLDLSERKRVEADARESDRRYREGQMELAHANRVAVMGPIAASVANAEAALRFLSNDRPDIEEVREALDTIVSDGNRAADIVSRIQDHIKKAPPRKEHVEINDAILKKWLSSPAARPSRTMS